MMNTEVTENADSANPRTCRTWTKWLKCDVILIVIIIFLLFGLIVFVIYAYALENYMINNKDIDFSNKTSIDLPKASELLKFTDDSNLLLKRIRRFAVMQPDISSTSFVNFTTSRPKTHLIATNNTNSLCCTASCVFTAANLLNSMDSKADPCENFYHFTCGGYVQHRNLNGARTVSTLSDIADNINGKIKNLVSEDISSKDIRPFVLAKKLYKACMNTAQIERRGFQPVKDQIKLLGGWPVVEGNHWNSRDFSWQSMMSKLRQIGYYPDSILRINIFPDLKNASYYRLYIVEPTLNSCKGCSAEETDTYALKYLWLMVQIAVKFGADPVDAFSQLRDSIKFETNLASITVVNDNGTYNWMAIKDVQTKYPYIQWLEYLNSVLKLEKPLSETDLIVMTAGSYLTNLETILNATSNRTKANYIIWRMVADSLAYISDSNYYAYYRNRLGGGIKSNLLKPDRSEECIRVTSHIFSTVIGSLYIRRYFENDVLNKVRQLVDQFVEGTQASLSDAKWMDDDTRSSAVKKIRTLTSIIGYPNELLNDTALIKYYQTLDVYEQEYFDSVLKISKFNQQQLESKMWKRVVKGDWITHGSPTKVNAFYYANENIIGLPAAILQNLIFASDRPNYINYATIGFIVGHEISHAFYDPGRKFDGNGNYSPWWKNDTIKNFEEKALCIQRQYGNFSDHNSGIRLNSRNTFAENLADNSGIELAYRSYNTWREKQSAEELALPGLERYTAKQLFWISLGSAWCSKDDAKFLQFSMQQADHSPNKFRIIGIVSNQQSFANDFNCPVGSPMNPKNKCKIW